MAHLTKEMVLAFFGRKAGVEIKNPSEIVLLEVKKGAIFDWIREIERLTSRSLLASEKSTVLYNIKEATTIEDVAEYFSGPRASKEIKEKVFIKVPKVKELDMELFRKSVIQAFEEFFDVSYEPEKLVSDLKEVIDPLFWKENIIWFEDKLMSKYKGKTVSFNLLGIIPKLDEEGAMLKDILSFVEERFLATKK